MSWHHFRKHSSTHAHFLCSHPTFDTFYASVRATHLHKWNNCSWKKRCWTAKPARATYYYFILSDGPCLSAPLVRLLSRFPTPSTVPIRFIFSPILNHRNPHRVLKRFGSLLADTRIITFPLRWTTYVSQGAKSIKSSQNYLLLYAVVLLKATKKIKHN